MFHIPIHRRLEFSGKGLWTPKATASVTHIHILPTYKPELRYFILPVTKRKRKPGNIFFYDQEQEKLSKRNSTKTRSLEKKNLAN